LNQLQSEFDDNDFEEKQKFYEEQIQSCGSLTFYKDQEHLSHSLVCMRFALTMELEYPGMMPAEQGRR